MNLAFNFKVLRHNIAKTIPKYLALIVNEFQIFFPYHKHFFELNEGVTVVLIIIYTRKFKMY